ncbi:formylglycine-generating enzyme family protein, partial [candidate division KSB1 bacterium]|nr:formylglycine-generating enzyme family protein [candidate division KSB1 bacterium]NIS22563.1 formylglycine-generating enzyme family protein [candidate division KSB1 bacterium]NIT69406.1 formylglycine-generating enzyme family protein [candidate division KSB1 bacterium]NIU23061.1 formylglycine-generating enzyme family protein [candidate division KSB1 bacterium]NIU89413.1 SUMF1/EgtB/PvdO family nonheme iron enzyme [candidate division KSB1 bacterium]
YIEFVEFGEFDRYRACPGFEEYPVIRLSWYGAAAFCDFYGLRLPTEAEWELVSRGGQQFEYGTANGTISHDLANFLGTGGMDTFEGLAPIGSFPANPFGLHDLCGNAAEYVFDIFDFQFYGMSPSHNPFGPGPAKPLGRLPAAGRPLCRDGGPKVVWRGGHWLSDPASCSSAFRGSAC